MAAENLLVYNGRYRQTVETVGKRLPQLYVVSPLAYNTSVASCSSEHTFTAHTTFDSLYQNDK